MMLRFLGKNKISTHYIPGFLVKLRIGGNSNRNFFTYFKSLRQDYLSWVKIWPNNRVAPLFSVVYKKVQKIPQFFIKIKN
jgi:glycosyltransferase